MLKELAKRLGFLQMPGAHGKPEAGEEKEEKPVEAPLPSETPAAEEEDVRALFQEVPEEDVPEEILEELTAEEPVTDENAAGEDGIQNEFEAGVRACQAKDYQTGLELLTHAAGQGLAQAQFLCGYMYREGIGVEADGRQALTWLRRAGKQGFLEAQLACAELYETGTGTKMNLKQALYWYEQAAKQGSLPAQLKCGNMYYRGRAETRNPKKARRWLEAAAEQGSEEASALLRQYF